VTSESSDRYARQRLFAPFGSGGQAKLAAARVTLVGCGALGTHLAQHLVRAGVGRLRICDRDFVELNNLQRQVLFDEEDVRQNLPKAAAAAAKLSRVNGEVAIEARIVDVNPSNVESLISDADLVLDGTDNFETRFLLNDACLKLKKPWVYGGCVGADGMVLAVLPGKSPCFRCFVPDPPEPGSVATCDTAGVLGPAVGVVASLQAAEALKLLTGRADALAEGLITVDVWGNRQHIFKMSRSPECPACGKGRYDFLEGAASGAATTLCGRNAVQIVPGSEAKVDLAGLESRLSGVGAVKRNEYLLRLDADGFEVTVFPDGRAIIRGTDDPARARAVYAKYVGS
jgi:molybdopterin-synthase adenylyltransferase